MKPPISLGLGEQAITRDPEDVLVAYGLGSCVAVTMIDPVSHVSGLLHAVLPRRADGSESRRATAGTYVDDGIEGLIAAMVSEGAQKARLVVRLVGGANMLLSPAQGKTSFDIGTRNVDMAHTTLRRLNLPVAAEEVGGHTGRTVRLYVGDSRVTVRVIGEKEHEI